MTLQPTEYSTRVSLHMAKNRAWIILLNRGTWRLIRLQNDSHELLDLQAAEGSDEKVAATICEALRSAGYAGEPVVVALDSSRCVHVALDLPNSRIARQRTSMKYLIEPHIPWAAEDVVLDHQVRGTRAFSIVARREPLATLLKTLEDHGILVEAVCPFASLALASHLVAQEPPGGRSILAWAHDEETELWLIDGTAAVDWRWCELSSAAIKQSIRQWMLVQDPPLRVVARELPPDIERELSSEDILLETSPASFSASYLEAGIEAAHAILDGRRNAPFNLRHDAIPTSGQHRALRGPISAVQLAAALLLVCTSVACFVKARQYDAHRVSFTNLQRDEFERVFPNARVPIGVRSRLESELSRLKGMRGGGGELPKVIESFYLVERLLASLPPDMRFRLLEIRAEDGRLYIVGQVREHADSDRIANSLRAAGLEVGSPSTHRLQSAGIEFRLSGRVAASPAQGDSI